MSNRFTIRVSSPPLPPSLVIDLELENFSDDQLTAAVVKIMEMVKKINKAVEGSPK